MNTLYNTISGLVLIQTKIIERYIPLSSLPATSGILYWDGINKKFSTIDIGNGVFIGDGISSVIFAPTGQCSE